MKKSTMIALLLGTVLIAATIGSISAATRDSKSESKRRLPIDDKYSRQLVGQATGYGGAKADTVYLMGGGGPQTGDFEDSMGAPDLDGWTTVDRTLRTEARWSIDSFNCQNLDPGTVPNHAWWCGQDYEVCMPGDPPEGYGNDWLEYLDWQGAVYDSGLNTTVTVTCVLNYDTEVGYDHLYLEYEGAGGMQEVISFNGQDAMATVNESFLLTPADYVGATLDKIHLRWRFDSDSGWSDQDCDWPTAGAAQIDLIEVTFNQSGYGSWTASYEDCEGAPVWSVVLPVGVGDFSKVWPYLDDLDPCSLNDTPRPAFIDDGLVVPGTGGYLCTTWCYGPGGYVVNPEGGLAGPNEHLECEIWSPVLDRPAPGENPADGAMLEFDVYEHLPINSPSSAGIFWRWHVRSSDDGGLNWSIWENDDFVHYGETIHARKSYNVSEYLLPGWDKVQIALGVVEMGWVWGWEGTDAAPAPYFDNVAFKVFEIPGPLLTARERDLAQDSFPASGGIDIGNLGNNSVRFDMASDISMHHQGIDSGDSVVIAVATPRLGTALSGAPLMKYKLRPNPLYDPHRTSGQPNEGTVVGRAPPTIPDSSRWYFDLPDTAFFFPGDVIHYYFTAQDNLADLATLPGDTTGYNNFSSAWPGQIYPASFTVRALPSMWAADPDSQPRILCWNDGGNRGGEDEWGFALANIGLSAGSGYDLYYTNDAAASIGAGIGSRATPDQLAGYTVMLYSCGELSWATITNGDVAYRGSDDVGLLEAWLQQSGSRGMLLTGDNLAFDLSVSGAANLAFLNARIGVDFVQQDVQPLIGGQTTPLIRATAAGEAIFTQTRRWHAYSECPNFRTFDAVQVRDTTQTLAEFADYGENIGIYPYPAVTLHEITGGEDYIFYMPYAFKHLYTESNKVVTPAAARSKVLDDILFFLNQAVGTPAGVPSLVTSTATCAAPVTVSVYTRPDGFGDPLSDCFGMGGDKIYAAVTATLRDPIGTPIVNYPAEDVWLETENHGLSLYPGGSIADGNSDGTGMMSFSGAVRGGGSSGGENAYVVIDGDSLTNSPLDILFNSPDMDGDLGVDLSDFVLFSRAWPPSPYAYAADYYYDGAINLSDLVLWNQASGVGNLETNASVASDVEITVYFDIDGCYAQCLNDYGGFVSAYLVVEHLPDPVINGYECAMVYSPEPIVVSQVPLGPQALNSSGDPDRLHVGYGAPWAVNDSTAVIAQLDLFILAPYDTTEIFIKHGDPTSVPNDSVPVLIGSTLDHYWEMTPWSGSQDLPVASINRGLLAGHKTGSLSIDSEPDSLNATWQMTSATGVSAVAAGDTVITGLPIGPYYVTWEDIPGWVSPGPSPYIDCVAEGDTAGVAGTYYQPSVVFVNPDPDALNAPWRLQGPEGYDNSSSGDQTLTDMRAGIYTLTWQAVAGWQPPDPNPLVLSLAQDDTIAFCGTYLEHGSVQVDPDPDLLMAPWQLDGPYAQSYFGSGDSTFASVPPGDYTLTWGVVSGWASPAPNPDIKALPEAGAIAFCGTYSPAPQIVGVTDVGNDQGRQLRIVWNRCVYDAPGDTVYIDGYELYRRQDAYKSSASTAVSRPASEWAVGDDKLLGWDYLLTVPAHGEDAYQYVAPTLCDSTVDEGVCWTVFFVRAVTPDPFLFYDSPPDSGYSTDDIAPETLKGMSVDFSHDENRLSWDDPVDVDVEYYKIYRAETVTGGKSECNPMPEQPVATTVETSWTDDLTGTTQSAWEQCYWVTAVDVSGNEGEPTAWESTSIAGVDDPTLPRQFALHHNTPNPFNPTTTIGFELPSTVPVTLEIFDVSGRHVCTLLRSDSQAAGRHEVVWDGRDAAGQIVAAGVYIYRLQAGKYRQARRMILIK